MFPTPRKRSRTRSTSTSSRRRAKTGSPARTRTCAADRHVDVVRTVVEQCWAGADGLDRMESMVTTGYVHHTPFGDSDFAGFRQGLAHVDTVFADRTYRVEHVVHEGELAAAYLSWTATRRSDGTGVSG